MKNMTLLIGVLLLFISVNVRAQFKPSEKQYQSYRGALLNNGFEQGLKGWTNTNGIFSTESITPLLGKQGKIALTAQTLEIESDLNTSLSSFSGKQGVAFCRIKTDVANTKFIIEANGVDDISVSVNPNDEWQFLDIPFVINETSNNIKLTSDSATGTVYFDDCDLKLAPQGYVSQVAQSYFVGSYHIGDDACSSWQRNNTSWGKTTADADCANGTSIGGVTVASDLTAGINIPNVRTDGYYTVNHQGLLYNDANSPACYFTLSTTESQEQQGVAYLEGSNGRHAQGLYGNFRFTTSGNKDVFIVSRSNSSQNCIVYGQSGLDSKFTAHFYPDSTSTAVTQNATLHSSSGSGSSANTITANTERIDFKITEDNTNSWSQVDGNGLDTFTPYKTTNYLITGMMQYTTNAAYQYGIYEDGVFHKQLVTNNLSGVRKPFSQVFKLTKGKAYDFRSNITGALADSFSGHYISIKEVSTEATILGKFENINSTDLVKVIAEGNAEQAITVGNAFPFIEIEDNRNAWDGTTFTNVKPSKVLYHVNGTMAGTLGSALTSMMVDRSVGADKYLKLGQADQRYPSFNGYVELEAGETMFFKTGTSGTFTLANSSSIHHLTITEQPDTESIIANAMDNVNKTECQTKKLVNNLTTNITIPDFTFNNLTVGKLYEVYLRGRISTGGNIGGNLTAVNDAVNVGFQKVYASNSGATSGSKSKFTASSSVMTVISSGLSASGVLTGGDNILNSYVELCELPSTTIETTKFN